MNKRILVLIGVMAIITIGAVGGFLYNTFKTNSASAHTNELSTLQASFIQQYGNQVTIKQIVEKPVTYAVLGTSGDGVDHVFVYIGGVWAVFWNAPTPAPKTP